MSHFVRGTLAIEWEASSLKIRVTPGAGFLTPEVAPRAIAFPVPSPPGPPPSDVAQLIPLIDNKFDLDATAFRGDVAGLIAIAAAQKLIEIRVEPPAPPATPPPWKLVSFAFPVS